MGCAVSVSATPKPLILRTRPVSPEDDSVTAARHSTGRYSSASIRPSLSVEAIVRSICDARTGGRVASERWIVEKHVRGVLVVLLKQLHRAVDRPVQHGCKNSLMLVADLAR